MRTPFLCARLRPLTQHKSKVPLPPELQSLVGEVGGCAAERQYIRVCTGKRLPNVHGRRANLPLCRAHLPLAGAPPTCMGCRHFLSHD
jgi:hypothetical protein